MSELADQTRLQEILKSLEKLTDDKDYGCIKDALNALQTLTVTSNLIEKTRAGNQISAIRKLFSGETSSEAREVSQICKDILSNWRTTVKDDGASLKLRIKAGVRQAVESRPPASRELLSERRLKVVQLMKSALCLSSSDQQAVESCAYGIEEAIYARYPEPKFSKDYEAKTRSLFSNLRRNQVRLHAVEAECHVKPVE
jgi:hypothetical protein